MHEYSIACEIWQSVIQAVERYFAARPNRIKLRSIKLAIGELNLLETEQLTFWLKQLAAREGAGEPELKIQFIPGKISCQDCGKEAILTRDSETDVWSHVFFATCSGCGSDKVEIVEGRELRVISAEIDMEEYNGNNGSAKDALAPLD